MSAVLELKHSALLVLDWQLFFVSPDSPACLASATAAEGNVRALVDFFLAAGRSVFATRHSHARGDTGPFLRFYGRLLYEDDPLAALAPFLKDREGIRVVPKDTYSAFVKPGLSRELEHAGVEDLILAGLQTDKCVTANALAAFDLGFRVAVAADACAARDHARHVEALGLLERSCATVASTRDILGVLA